MKQLASRMHVSQRNFISWKCLIQTMPERKKMHIIFVRKKIPYYYVFRLACVCTQRKRKKMNENGARHGEFEETFSWKILSHANSRCHYILRFPLLFYWTKKAENGAATHNKLASNDIFLHTMHNTKHERMLVSYSQQKKFYKESTCA